MEAWKLEECDHGPRRRTVDPNGHRQSFHPSCSSVHGDDPPISEDVVSLEQCSRLLAADFQLRCSARCPRLTVDHKRCRHVWDERTEGGTLGTGGTVSPVMSFPSRSFTVMLMLVRTAGKGSDQ